MVHLTKILPVIGLTLLVACDPPDRQADVDGTRDTATAETDRRVTAGTHRQDVQEAWRDTRNRMDQRQSRISERSEDLWDRISDRASETWRDIESGLEGIGDDDPESIHQSRDDAARRLAELEAEVAEAEVSTARTAEELRDVSNEWIEQVESDISHMERLLPQIERSAMARDRVDLDGDDLRDMRDRVREMRAEVQEAVLDQEGLERREDLAGDLSDLVKDARETRYRLQWSQPRTARR